ncbi:hypothetical protein BVRB_034230 [Beta vulgaris subsp. vulgaris]|uniref:Uncharacterized protein n=1 Tax=Beta vulgaris subsp. vulgaris TaxID=3555 RepID=A0A0J8BLE3_BETVV|nr:hypothetical protein BVRB_034230 [Beta vulgaris subsp. vulgaris]
MSHVDGTGLVLPSFPSIHNWKPSSSMVDVLCALREAMVSASKLPQPPIDSTY